MSTVLSVLADVPGIEHAMVFDARDAPVERYSRAWSSTQPSLEVVASAVRTLNAVAESHAMNGVAAVVVLFEHGMLVVRAMGSLLVAIVAERDMDLALVEITLGMIRTSMAGRAAQGQTIRDLIDKGLAHGLNPGAMEWDRDAGPHNVDVVGAPVMRHLMTVFTSFTIPDAKRLLELELARRGRTPSTATAQDFSDLMTMALDTLGEPIVADQFRRVVLGDEVEEG